MDPAPEPQALAIGAHAPPGSTVDAGTAPPAALVEELVARGEAVLVTLKDADDDDPEDPGLLAAAAVYAWLGVRILRVPERQLPAVRQVLDMVAAIRGTRPPKETRRGLA